MGGKQDPSYVSGDVILIVSLIIASFPIRGSRRYDWHQNIWSDPGLWLKSKMLAYLCCGVELESSILLVRMNTCYKLIILAGFSHNGA